MKKIVFTIISILALFLIYIIYVNNSSKNYNFDKITTSFIINYNKDKVNSIDVYNGNEIYFIIKYDYKKEKYIGVLDKKEKLLYEVKSSDLFNIKDKNKIVGYKDKKLVYEVKKQTKSGYTYYYYNAITGEFIKKIIVDK